VTCLCRGAVVALVVVLLAEGVTRAEPARGAAAAAASPSPTQSAADSYAANAFMIVHVGKHGDAVDEKGSTWRPLRGLVYRFSLEPPEFLDAVGRSDLADHERTRHATARTLSIVGDIVAPIGLFTTLYGLGVAGGRVALIGLGGIVGGVIMHETGESMLTPALPESEALQLADDHNRKLRARLGLPALDVPTTSLPRDRSGGGLALAFGAFPLPNGGVAILGARF